MTIKVLKQMVEALETAWTYDEDNADGYYFEAIEAGKQAIAELESQEPVAWMYEDDYQRMLTSETFCTVYSVKVGSPDKGVTDVPLYTTPPQRTEQNFCSRCGKRTNDIHTCTPPQD